MGLWPLANEGEIRIWSISVALIFLILGIVNSKILNPLNKKYNKKDKTYWIIRDTPVGTMKRQF